MYIFNFIGMSTPLKKRRLTLESAISDVFSSPERDGTDHQSVKSCSLTSSSVVLSDLSEVCMSFHVCLNNHVLSGIIL